MTKTLLVLATASTLTLSVALAQNSSNPSSGSPGMSQSGGTSGSAMDGNNTDKSTINASGSPSAPNIIASQSPDEWLATKFKGTQVIGQDDSKIGSVDDIMFDKSGKVKAVIVGVGGFLGIGSKDVGLALSSFQVVPGKDGNADQLRLSMTKEQLTAAAEFKPYEPPRPTASNTPSGNPTRPSTSGSATPMTPAGKTQ
jgi:hypothetical protein